MEGREEGEKKRSEEWKNEEGKRVGRRRNNVERIQNEPGRVARAFLMSLKCKCKRDIITGKKEGGREGGGGGKACRSRT